MNCADNQCLDCVGDHKVCKTCDEGFHVDSEGKCSDCDDVAYIKCKRCEANPEGGSTCLECAEGFRLQDGKCIKCEQIEHCSSCSESTCQACFEGYQLIS